MAATPEQILSQLKLSNDCELYQVGCTATLVTVSSQQTRAFNLAWALSKRGIVNATSHVAVVGGGIAGVTMALALSALTTNIHIFEEKSDWMHLQSGNITRFIHPNFSQWPNRGFCFPLTDLPYMNWSAGTAGDVEAQLYRQWSQAIANKLPIEQHLGTRVLSITPGKDKRAIVRFENSGGEETSEPFNVVVVCAGFGLERNEINHTKSYWRNDDLAQPVLGLSKAKRVMVCGSGDGGLIDVLRLSLKNFHHQSFIQHVMYSRELSAISHAIAAIGNEDQELFWQSFIENQPQQLVNETLVENACNEISKFVKKVRPDTSVILCHTTPNPFQTPSFPLHRLLVGLLLRLGIVSRVQGRLAKVVNRTKEQDFQIAVITQNTHLKLLFVDEVIERIGANFVLPKLVNLPEAEINALRNGWPNGNKDFTAEKSYGDFFTDYFQQFHNEVAYEVGIQINSVTEARHLSESFLSRCGLPTGLSNGMETPLKFDDVQSGHWLIIDQCIHREVLPIVGSWCCNRDCLRIKTNSRLWLDVGLGENSNYHFFRIYYDDAANKTFAERDAEGVRLGNLYMRDSNQSISMTWNGGNGLRQAHNLLRLPTAIQIMQNRWPTTRAHGFSWAVQQGDTLKTDQDVSKNLLQWDTENAWWLPRLQN